MAFAFLIRLDTKFQIQMLNVFVHEKFYRHLSNNKLQIGLKLIDCPFNLYAIKCRVESCKLIKNSFKSLHVNDIEHEHLILRNDPGFVMFTLTRAK